jgi:hypothetical protein
VEKSLAFALLRNGNECLCYYEAPEGLISAAPEEAVASGCDVPCAGNESIMCGGKDALAGYRLEHAGLEHPSLEDWMRAPYFCWLPRAFAGRAKVECSGDGAGDSSFTVTYKVRAGNKDGRGGSRKGSKTGSGADGPGSGGLGMKERTATEIYSWCHLEKACKGACDGAARNVLRESLQQGADTSTAFEQILGLANVCKKMNHPERVLKDMPEDVCAQIRHFKLEQQKLVLAVAGVPFRGPILFEESRS